MKRLGRLWSETLRERVDGDALALGRVASSIEFSAGFKHCDGAEGGAGGIASRHAATARVDRSLVRAIV